MSACIRFHCSCGRGTCSHSLLLEICDALYDAIPYRETGNPPRNDISVAILCRTPSVQFYYFGLLPRRRPKDRQKEDAIEIVSPMAGILCVSDPPTLVTGGSPMHNLTFSFSDVYFPSHCTLVCMLDSAALLLYRRHGEDSWVVERCMRRLAGHDQALVSLPEFHDWRCLCV